MSSTPTQKYRCLPDLPTSRPSCSRQRSNSLPIGLLSLNSEEAGILFSAAARATSRRRRRTSFDSPFHSSKDLPPIPQPLWPNSSAKTTELSTNTNANTSLAETRLDSLDHYGGASHIYLTPILTSSSSQGMAEHCEVLTPLPIDPPSPNRRQVPTCSLKSYADGLYHFTQDRLVSSIPEAMSDLISPQSLSSDYELDSSVNSSTHISRPNLESKFSEWSIATGGVNSRRQSLATPQLPSLNLDSLMLTPVSLFREIINPDAGHTAHQPSSAVAYASSIAYEPPRLHIYQSISPANTIKSRKEISYFTDYQKFLEPSSEGPDLVPDSLDYLMDFPSWDRFSAPITPPVHKQSHVRNIQHPSITRSYSSGKSISCSSTPTRFCQVAEVAIRVSGSYIGAVH